MKFTLEAIEEHKIVWKQVVPQ